MFCEACQRIEFGPSSLWSGTYDYVLHASNKALEESAQKRCALCHFFFNSTDIPDWADARLTIKSQPKALMDFYFWPHDGRTSFEIVEVPGEVVALRELVVLTPNEI
ncbi:hypothetical protein ACJ41O_003793 [Fusarium nematophilum]